MSPKEYASWVFTEDYFKEVPEELARYARRVEQAIVMAQTDVVSRGVTRDKFRSIHPQKFNRIK